MTAEQLRKEAMEFQKSVIEDRRYLHTHPGTEFDIKDTLDYVKKKLEDLGYHPVACGKAGLVAMAGGKKDGKVFLLRADSGR